MTAFENKLPREMQISEAELRAMTAEMVEMHHATFPQMRAALSDFGAALRRRRFRSAAIGADRRKLVVTGSGLILGSMFLTACGDDDDAAQDPAQGAPGSQDDTDGGESSGELLANDADALKLNASIENLAVFAYTSALEAAPKGKFGNNVPKAVAEFATHAKAQHAEHAQAFNAALTNAGQQAYTDPTPALAPAVQDMFAKTDTVPKLAMLALTLENTAAATYVQQMGGESSQPVLSAVATIAPVERQHAAILNYVLGNYPIPDTFVQLEKTKTSLGAQDASALTPG